MLPPPNPPSGNSNTGAPHRPRPYPLHRAPLSTTSTSTSTSGASSSSSAASVPLVANLGAHSQDPRQYDRASYDEEESMPIAGPSRPRRELHPRPSVAGYGSAMELESGCLKGKTVRFSLVVAQEPIHGRRKTEKDRRPLAHCPILRFKLRQVHRDGAEDDIDVAALEPGCFVCAAELFEVSSNSAPSITPTRADGLKSRPPGKGGTHPSHPDKLGNQSTGRLPRVDGETFEDPAGQTVDHKPHPPPTPPHRAASWAADGPTGMAGMSAAARLRAEAVSALPPPSRPPVPHPTATTPDSSASVTPQNDPRQDTNRTSRIARPVDVPDTLTRQSKPGGTNAPTTPSRPGTLRTAAQRSSGSSGDGESMGVKPSSKRPKQGGEDNKWSASNQITGVQRNLFGSLHVPAVRVVAPEGEMGLWFLFTDLSVRQEGTFALRFRVFDITAADKAARSAAPTLIEARTRAFKVYSPRNFPGLPKPTELAEHFGKQGFKLNTRKNERQAKTPPPEDSDATTTVPHRPDAHPLQSGSSSDGSKAGGRAEVSGSGSDSGPRPGTAGTTTTTAYTNTTGSASLSGESAGTVGTVATSVSTGGSSKGLTGPSPLSRSFPDRPF